MTLVGYIRLYRKIREHWIFQEKRRFSKFEAFIDMIFLCNHKCVRVLIGNSLVLVKRGQFISSNIKLGKVWSWNEKSVRNFLMLLEQEGMVKIKSTRKYTLYEVVNYSEYQSVEYQEFKSDSFRTKSEQNPSKIRIESEQNPTNNNDNNEKNEKKKRASKGGEEVSKIGQEIQKYYGAVSPAMHTKILSYLDKGLDEDVIIECIRESALGAHPQKYVESILDRCVNGKITNLQLYIDQQRQFKKNQSEFIQQMKAQKGKIPQQENFQKREYEEVDYDQYFEPLDYD